MHLLSMVIPNYNYAHYLDRFFSSIESQTLPLADVQIIFVDDGSSDDSVRTAGKWGCKLKCANFEIHTPGRSGRPGPVRNYGLRKASGKFLLCLDPDDVLRSGYLESCIDVLEKNETTGLVYTDYLEKSSDGSHEVLLPDFKPVYLRTQNPLSPAAMYRRELWDSGVRYRDNTAYEDWDFWIQCLMIGTKFRHIPELLYIYEIHEGSYSIRAVKDDGPSKANIVLNNPGFFHAAVMEWARDHLRGRVFAPAFQRGYIPTPEEINKVMDLYTQR